MNGHRWASLVGSLLVFFFLAQNAAAETTSQSRSLAGYDPITLVSAGSSGDGGGTYAAISGSGRYISFESPALDLLPGDVSGSWDTYLQDQQTGHMMRVSTRSGGAAVYNPGDYTSPPSVSADGRFVAFMSNAEDLVGNDGNHAPDVFVHDRLSNTTELISVAPVGESGNDASYTPAISADGRFVAFQSYASNLVPGDNNNSMDVFIRDRQAGTTELVSVTSSGAQGSDSHDYGFPGVSVSNDGRYVAFAYQTLPVSGAPTATGPNIYLRDRQSRTTRWIAAGSLPALSGDGRFLAFITSDALLPADKNNGPDVYLLDLSTNQLERVSAPNGVPDTASPDITITDPPALSSDGRYIAFATSAALVPGDTNGLADIYLLDRQTAVTQIISTAVDGTPGNGESHFPTINADGSEIGFTSLASNLVAGDTNGQNDVFVYHHQPAAGGTAVARIFFPMFVNH